MKIILFGKEVLSTEKAESKAPVYNNCAFGQPFPVYVQVPQRQKLSAETLDTVSTAISIKTGFEKEIIERVLRALETLETT
jgi:hypothetical protein